MVFCIFWSKKEIGLHFCSCVVQRPCPDEPARLKATVPENPVKLGETVTEPISELAHDHSKEF